MTSSAAERDTSSPRLALWALWGYLALYGAWALAMFEGIVPRGVLNDTIFLPFYLAAVVAARRAARDRADDHNMSHGWRLISLAWAASVIGGVLWILSDLTGSQVLIDAGWFAYNAYYPFTLVALWTFFERPTTRNGWLRLVVEALIVAVSTVVLAWYFVFRFHEAVTSPAKWASIIGLLLTGETLVMVGASMVLHRPARTQDMRALTLLAASLFLASISDFLYQQFDLIKSAWSGPTGDVLLAVAACLLVAAAFKSPSERRSAVRSPAVNLGLSLIPYLAVSVVAGLLIYESARVNLGAGTVAGLIIAGATLLLLVIARSLLSQRDLHAEWTRRQEQDARFRLLVQHSSDALLVVTPTGDLRFASPVFARMLALGDDDLAGRSLREFVSPATWGTLSTWLQSSPNGTLKDWQLSHNGRRIEVEAAGADLTENPLVGGVVLNVRDVTSRVQLEGELRQAQAMEVAGRLSSSIAHDFNNLLTVIIGNLHLAQLKGPAHADLGAVEAAARRGAALARQLLSLSRPARMPSVGVDLPGAIRALEPSLRNALPSSIHFTVETSHERIHVGPDLVQIEQVLLNLLLNARDAMPAGGQLRVLADVVGEGESRRARLVVTDSGIGMNDETLAHVFEPFFTTKPAGFGTGLGLATVRRIVAAAHGEVEIATKPGGGTSVTVLLPLVARDAAAPTREVTPATVTGRGRVLLVDDEPEIRRVLSSILSEFGFQVSAAANGMEALSILASDRAHIDVVVTDLTMPHLGGEGLCRQIAKFYPGLPTLCISGTPDNGASEGESWSGDRVILKPVSFDELVSRIDEELASGASLG